MSDRASFSGGSLKEIAERLAATPEEVYGLLAIERSERPAQTPGPLPASPAAMLAAISVTFLLEEIGAEGQEREAIVANSELVSVGATQRLRLTNASRGALINSIAARSDFLDILREAGKRDQLDFDEISEDPIRRPSAWLRSFLLGNAGDIHGAPPAEVRAAVAALECLCETKLGAKAPSLAAAQRALELSELLEPLRILIGAEGGWDRSRYSDRFAGRSQELAQLRAFVDELESESGLESIHRGFKRTKRHLMQTAAEVMVIEAQGGLGKSALIAKFVLDHAIAQVRSFPFVYIDFDRATLQPREPLQLLNEAIRQVRLQCSTGLEEFADLRERVRMSLQGRVQREQNFYREFQHLLREHADVGQVAFLLVLDTMEVAQYDDQALAGVDRFLFEMIGREGFPELRIVVAGRAGLGDMTFLHRTPGAEALPLKPLSIKDARAMAGLLGKSLLKDEWRSVWEARIVGEDSDSEERREPLSVRVAVDTIRAAKPSERETLTRDMAKMGEDAHMSFVGRLYERRVLKHINDPDARKLAWPGLIVRNVTRDIVRRVLAETCKLAPERVEHAFSTLAREVWIVERHGEGEDAVLSHKRELRARTLPLMRRHNPEVFHIVNARARDYFGERRELPAAHAEWIYHRLLAGVSVESVDRDWRAEDAPYLADASIDFPKQDPAHGYLLGRTSVTPITGPELLSLPTWLAFENIARSGAPLSEFAERRISPELVELSQTEPPQHEMSIDASATRTALFIKAGVWNVELDTSRRSEPLSAHVRFALSYRRARDRRFQAPPVLLSGPVDRGSYRWAAQELAAARIRGEESDFRHLDQALASGLGGLKIADANCDRASLAIASVFGRDCVIHAARQWAASQFESSNSELLSISGAELRVLGAIDLGPLASAQDRKLLKRWIGVARDRHPMCVVGEEADALLRRLLERLSVSEPADVTAFARLFLAQRREDWITPFAYAAARAVAHLPGKSLHVISQRLKEYSAHALARPLTHPPHDRLTEQARDFVHVFRCADQAGDLAGMAALIASLSDNPKQVQDLNHLIACEREWSKQIEAVLQLREDGAAAPSAKPPRAGPILDDEDQQKGRWGGRSEDGGRRLRAAIRETSSRSLFELDLLVESVDGTRLQGPVVFHLHSTFKRSVITIQKIRDERLAGLYEITSYGAFTAAAQVRRADGVWIGLELDLSEDPALPQRFRDR